MNALFPASRLSAAQLDAKRRQLMPPLFELAESIEEIPDGLRLTFAARPGWLQKCGAVIEQEQAAGSFLRFRLTVEAKQGEVTFEITGLPGTGSMLRALSRPDGQQHEL
jgi:hypothetical protein